jgi:5-methylcytosine-specific restriction endonuclease McrA
MNEVLVLNRNYFAIHVADWQKVMCLLYKGHAVVVDEQYATYNFEQWRDVSQAMEDSPSGFIHAVNFKIAIPEIILLTFYDKLPKSEVKFTRKNIYKHYNFKCCYCGKRFGTDEVNLDHVIPKSRGGKTEWNNIVLTCVTCNSNKSDKTPREAGFKMYYKPSKPQWRPSYAVRINTGMRVKQSWRKFIDSVYWNGELSD